MLQDLKDKNHILEIDMQKLQNAYQTTWKDYSEALDLVKSLQSQIDIKTEKDEKYHLMEKNCDILQQLLDKRDQNILDLKSAANTAQKVVNALNTKIIEKKTDFKKEKAKLLKDHRTEIKELKKKLGQANTKILKLQKANEASHESFVKHNNVRTTHEACTTSVEPDFGTEPDFDLSPVCSLCGNRIDGYIPSYFMGNAINPTCTICDVTDPDDPFVSFPTDGIPTSLAAHWIPMGGIETANPFISFKTHCVKEFNGSNKTIKEWDDIMFKTSLEDMLLKMEASLKYMENKLDDAILAASN